MLVEVCPTWGAKAEDALSDDCEVHPSDAYVRKARARHASAGDSPAAEPQTGVVVATAARPAPAESSPSSRKLKKAKRKRKRAADAACPPGGAPDEASAEDASARDASVNDDSRSTPGSSTPQPGDAPAARGGAAAATPDAPQPAAGPDAGVDSTILLAAAFAADVPADARTGTSDVASADVKKAAAAPVGVVVVADDAETARAPEVQRLLRAPRCALRCCAVTTQRRCAARSAHKQPPTSPALRTCLAAQSSTERCWRVPATVLASGGAPCVYAPRRYLSLCCASQACAVRVTVVCLHMLNPCGLGVGTARNVSGVQRQ